MAVPEDAIEVGPYLLNSLGDVCGRIEGSKRRELDPSDWGWTSKRQQGWAEHRRSVSSLAALAHFRVDITSEVDRWEPGPKPDRPRPYAWSPGHAPPVVVYSKDGQAGTCAYFDRLSEALGLVANRLPKKPDRSPFLVEDLVLGRSIRISYDPPPPPAEGTGRIYLVTDGDAVKVGFTWNSVAGRIGALQTGNPRPLRALVTLHDVPPHFEDELHAAFEPHARIGEWFDWQPLVAQALAVGGWEPLVRSLLPRGRWKVEVHASS